MPMKSAPKLPSWNRAGAVGGSKMFHVELLLMILLMQGQHASIGDPARME